MHRAAVDAGCGDGQRELRLHALLGAILDRSFLPSGTVFVEDARDPDIVALRTAGCTPAEMQRRIVRARWRFGWGPLLVAHYGEIAADPKANQADLDAVFSFAPTAGKNCRHERYWRSPHLAQHVAGREARAPDSLWARPKTRLSNFVYSNSNFSNTSVREDFARLLMRHGRVDCPGQVLNNTSRLPPNRVRQQRPARGEARVPVVVSVHDRVREHIRGTLRQREDRACVVRRQYSYLLGMPPGGWLSLSARAPRRRRRRSSLARRSWRWLGLLGRGVLF